MTKSQRLAILVVATGLATAMPARADVVTEWNAITLGCGQGPTTANRPGPPGLIDIAIVQLAVHDAVQAIQGRFESYQYRNPSLRGEGSVEAAAATAAYHALVGLYPGDDCLIPLVDPALTYAGDPGVRAGKEAAAALLPHYRPTMVLPTDPFVGGTGPGEWRPTPPALAPGANTFMANAPPFALLSSGQFRPGPPPALTSSLYAREYNEVKKLGSATSTHRTAQQTELARFWSVNFIAQWFGTIRAIADAHVPDVGDKARLFALAAVAAADSQISVYDAKYVYNFWRPITAIQNGDADGNSRTKGDAEWNSFAVNPPYPDWTSGANCITAAMTTVLQFYFKTDRFDYQVSSTAAGLTQNPRQYTRFSQAQREVVEARIYQGIHFRSADEEGRRQGVRVGAWAFSKILRPLPPRRWH